MDLEILLIDDDSIITMLHQTVLMQVDIKHPTKVFYDGDYALEYLENHPNKKNTKFLLFLDINMPRMSGWELLNAIQGKSYQDNCIVIMVTSSVDKRDKEKASTYKQVVDYIEKPFLRSHVERVFSIKEISEFK